MTLADVIKIVEGKVVCGGDYVNMEVKSAFASDLMSDVLTLDTDRLLLITGLTNLQTIRTAEMSDIQALLFVRNKRVSAEMIALANDNNMVIIECPTSMFGACGKLFSAGLPPVY